MSGKLLLCTDLDQTLISNGASAESPGAIALLKHWVESQGIRLAYVSGRNRELVEAAIQEFDLPRPNHVIGDVGTTLYHLEGSQAWAEDHSWSSAINKDWNGLNHEDLADLLGDLDGLELQPDERQGPNKLSYFSRPGFNVRPVVTRIISSLHQAGIRARAVTSETHDSKDGRETGFVDILPESASKYHAILHLMKIAGFNRETTLFSGDSGNDLEVLASPLPSILVANASDRVRQQAQQAARSGGHQNALYLASGNWLSMNGCYAAGILEGVAHFHPVWADWFAQQSRGIA